MKRLRRSLTTVTHSRLYDTHMNLQTHYFISSLLPKRRVASFIVANEPCNVY